MIYFREVETEPQGLFSRQADWGCDSVHLIMIIGTTLLILGVWERYLHNKKLHKIPVRINVSGIRGKSTVTRLITGILAEAGYITLGKTTGTSARLIFGNGGQEETIIRNPEGPNVNEQKAVTRRAADLRSEALVCECMAVDPEYQDVFQKQWLQATIGVITNVLPDHLAEMGPTLDDVAESLSAAIPRRGTIVIAPGPYQEYFQEVAKKRSTKVIVAEPERVSVHYLDQFSYIVFPENIALALAVAQCLSIDRKTAMRGMLKANPDPGVLQIMAVCTAHRRATYFANAFSANDPESTLGIWEHIRHLGYSHKRVLVVMNCRADRAERTGQFVRDVLPHLPMITLALTGKGWRPVLTAFAKGNLPAERILLWDTINEETQLRELKEEVRKHDFIFGIGNAYGPGEQIVNIMTHLAAEHSHKQLQTDKGLAVGGGAF